MSCRHIAKVSLKIQLFDDQSPIECVLCEIQRLEDELKLAKSRWTILKREAKNERDEPIPPFGVDNIHGQGKRSAFIHVIARMDELETLELEK